MRLDPTPRNASVPDLLEVALTAGGGDCRAALDALHVLCRDPAALAAWLRTFTRGAEAAAVAQRSYLHPNGFYKLVLDVGEHHRVRLHVWPAGRNRRGETNPHGHRWPFASKVLCGDGLLETSFCEHPLGRPYTRHTFTGGPHVSALGAARNVGLEFTDVRSVTRHECYTVDTTAVHTVDPLGSALVATLVVHGPARVGSTMVYQPSGRAVDDMAGPVGRDEVADLVATVVDAYESPAEQEHG